MAEHPDYTSRLLFLYNVVIDAQGTIRFLDTKAAFCVTLLTAMMAAAFQFSPAHPHFPRAHVAFLTIFATCTLVCLSVCVRVIFPTVHLQGSFSATGATEPPFFLEPQREHHRFREAFSNHPPHGLEATHAAYLASIMRAGDADLVRSMSDEAVTISVLRQVKSDRLHLAIQFLSVTVIAFFLQLAA